MSKLQSNMDTLSGKTILAPNKGLGPMNEAKLKTMLQLQDRLNCKVDPHWITAGRAWTRAIAVEGAEALEHLGWKWWKHQESNIPQVQIEMVDIWHFMLSDTLAEMKGQYDHAVNNFLWANSVDASEPLNILGRDVVVNLLTLHGKIDMMIGLAGFGYTSVSLFGSILCDLGMDWDDLYKQYVAKNVLNMFRQDHGYKTGHYVKEWFGQEDNVFLEELMATYPDGTPELLYGKLEARYADVPKPIGGAS